MTLRVLADLVLRALLVDPAVLCRLLVLADLDGDRAWLRNYRDGYFLTDSGACGV